MPIKLITAIPGPKSLEWAARLKKHESRNVTYLSDQFPVFWEKAEGAFVWDVDGNCFLDLTSGFGVATAGFGAQHLKTAYAEQSSRLYHGMGDVHPTRMKVELCELLSSMTFERWASGTGKVILGNAGFEAVEAALKTAYLHTGKAEVIAFHGGYHGLGYGAVTVTGRREFRSPFQAQLKEFAHFLPYPRAATDSFVELERSIRDLAATGKVGAILVEPIQGRGGEIIPPLEFIPLLRKLCDETGLLLILDEIYTGFYRSGSLFACEAVSVVPDIICLGKAMSGSFPISACVGKAAIMDAWPESTGEALHTSTFLGHPVGCALAVASLREWSKSETARRVKEASDWWEKELRGLADCPEVAEIRGKGLLWGIELRVREGFPRLPGPGGLLKKPLPKA